MIGWRYILILVDNFLRLILMRRYEIANEKLFMTFDSNFWFLFLGFFFAFFVITVFILLGQKSSYF